MATKPPKSKAKAKAPKAVEASPDIIQGVLESIQAEVGEDGAQLLGSDGLTIKIRGVIPTGVATLDAAIGRGGIPLGRLTILHGAEGCGKTTLALMIVAACQRVGGVVVYCDKEYKLDPDYATKLGCDTDHMIWAQPPYLERFFQTSLGAIKRAAEMRKKGKRVPILLVLDSMNAAITKAQYEGEWDAQHYAPQARVFSSLLPKLMPEIHKEDVAMLWISQVRKKMNVMFGNDEEIAGGNAPKFYASLILHIQRLGAQKNETGEKVSNKVRIEARKNQIAPPFKRADCQIVYGLGIDKEMALLVQAEKLGLVDKKGSWWSYNETRLGQGDDKAAEFLRKDAAAEEKIRKAVEKAMGW